MSKRHDHNLHCQYFFHYYYVEHDNDDTYFISGPVAICVDGTSYTLCNKGLNDSLASQLCQYNGYYGPAYATPLFGSDSDFRPITNSHALYDISCFDQYFDIHSCTYGLDDSGCGSYGGRAIITCLEEGEIFMMCVG